MRFYSFILARFRLKNFFYSRGFQGFCNFFEVFSSSFFLWITINDFDHDLRFLSLSKYCITIASTYNISRKFFPLCPSSYFSNHSTIRPARSHIVECFSSLFKFQNIKKIQLNGKLYSTFCVLDFNIGE